MFVPLSKWTATASGILTCRKIWKKSVIYTRCPLPSSLFPSPPPPFPAPYLVNSTSWSPKFTSISWVVATDNPPLKWKSKARPSMSQMDDLKIHSVSDEEENDAYWMELFILNEKQWTFCSYRRNRKRLPTDYKRDPPGNFARAHFHSSRAWMSAKQYYLSILWFLYQNNTVVYVSNYTIRNKL